eukprot:2996123-Rhodomonas_salina.10
MPGQCLVNAWSMPGQYLVDDLTLSMLLTCHMAWCDQIKAKTVAVSQYRKGILDRLQVLALSSGCAVAQTSALRVAHACLRTKHILVGSRSSLKPQTETTLDRWLVREVTVWLERFAI